MRLIFGLLVFCGLLSAANVTGKWSFTVETTAGNGSPTFTFKQDGNKLTGHYSGTLGEAELTGKLDGDSLEWSFPVSGQVEGTVTYKGALTAPDKMSGTVKLADVAEGTWTATKN